MSTLKTSARRIGKDSGIRHLGVKVPEGLATFLTLYSMAYGQTKSSIIIRLLRDWMLAQKAEEVDRDGMVVEITAKYLSEWKRRKAKAPNSSLKNYKETIITEMEWKGVPIEIIREILMGFNNATK